jgi:flavodoxin
MKIGIILYSYSGNTLSVGERLKQALLSKGYEVSLERIKVNDEGPQSGNTIQLSEIPDASQYDAIILGAPVQAFSLNPIMKVYLRKLPDLQGKKISCFVTEYFSKAWMGGNHAIKQIKRMVHNKNGIVTDSGVVNWSNTMRERQIDEIICRFSS